MSDGLLWLWLAFLLALSATFSGAETAFFSLNPIERRRCSEPVQALLARPRSLLVTVLFANLVINLLFFAFASRLFDGLGVWGEVWGGILALGVVVVLGESVPKTVALRARAGIARATALPMGALVRLLRPLRLAVEHMFVYIDRALGEAARSEGGTTPEILARALQRSAERGTLLSSEAQFLTGILELESVRVREVMTPRVDVVFLDVEEADPGPVLDEALDRKLAWVIAIRGSVDQVLGRVRLRHWMARERRPIEELLEPVRFVPEVASAMSVLHQMREKQFAHAVVVDEWGGTAGIVTIEDIFEEIVGELRVEGEVEAASVVDLGEGRFRVVGDLQVRDWNEQFGQRIVPKEFETVGGLVTALLDRIPMEGDVVRAGDLVFEVNEVKERRIVSVDVRVEPVSRRRGERGHRP